jgi:hypothetical protein
VDEEPAGREVNRPVGDPPIAGPLFHHLQQRGGITAAVVCELLAGGVVLPLEPQVLRRLQELDAALQQLSLLVRPRRTHLIVQAGKVEKCGFHGCKQRSIHKISHWANTLNPLIPDPKFSQYSLGTIPLMNGKNFTGAASTG